MTISVAGKGQSRRRALLTLGAVALGATAATRRSPFGTPAGAAVTLAPIQMNVGDGAAYTNTAKGRTHLRADRSQSHTLSLENRGTSTSASRGTLYAYLGDATSLPETDHCAAIRGINETLNPLAAGVSGVGRRGVFGKSTTIPGRGVRGAGDDGIGVEGLPQLGWGVHGLASGTGSVGVMAEGIDGATAFEAQGGKSVFGGRVEIKSELRIDADLQADDEPAIRVRNLERGAGLIISRTGDTGAPPRAGLSEGYAGVHVDLVNGDLEIPQDVGISVVTGAQTAFRAESNGGTALEVQGPAAFAAAVRCDGNLTVSRLGGPAGQAPVFENAGVATIAAGNAAVRVNDARVRPGVSILATIQGNAGAGVMLKQVGVLNGKFNLVLNKRAAKTVKIAYLIVGIA